MPLSRCYGVSRFQRVGISACWHIIGLSYGVTANQRPGVLLSNGMHEAAARNWAMGIVSRPGKMGAVGQPGEMSVTGQLKEMCVLSQTGTMEVVNQTEEMDDVGQPDEMGAVG